MKPGYKQTEVGVIPRDWGVADFGELFAITAGGDMDPARSATERDDVHRYPIYSNALTNAGLYGYCSYADHPADSITVTARGMVGHANYRSEAYTAIGRVLVLKPHAPSDCRYFAEVTNARVRFANESTGVPQLTAPQIAKYKLPVPPLPEQRAIAEALSDVDGLLGGLDRLIAKKRDLKQAAMQQLLTAQTRLPGFHGEWETKPLGEIAIIRKGELITGATVRPGSVPVVAGGREPAYYHDTPNRGPRCITISASGASAGYIALYNIPIFASDCSTIEETDAYSLDFLYNCLLLRQGAIYKMQTGGAQPHVQPSDLNPLAISIPPTKTEQTAIAEVLSEMDAELEALERRREKTRALKQAMMQQLLTGQIRLV